MLASSMIVLYLVLNAEDVTAWLYKVNMAKNFLVWIALKAQFSHLLSIGYHRFLITEHEHYYCLPILLIVLHLSFIYDLLLFVRDPFCIRP